MKHLLSEEIATGSKCVHVSESCFELGAVDMKAVKLRIKKENVNHGSHSQHSSSK